MKKIRVLFAICNVMIIALLLMLILISNLMLDNYDSIFISWSISFVLFTLAIIGLTTTCVIKEKQCKLTNLVRVLLSVLNLTFIIHSVILISSFFNGGGTTSSANWTSSFAFPIAFYAAPIMVLACILIAIEVFNAFLNSIE